MHPVACTCIVWRKRGKGHISGHSRQKGGSAGQVETSPVRYQGNRKIRLIKALPRWAQGSMYANYLLSLPTSAYQQGRLSRLFSKFRLVGRFSTQILSTSPLASHVGSSCLPERCKMLKLYEEPIPRELRPPKPRRLAMLVIWR